MYKYGGWVASLIFLTFFFSPPLGVHNSHSGQPIICTLWKRVQSRGQRPCVHGSPFLVLCCCVPPKRTHGAPSTSTGSLPCATPVHYKTYVMLYFNIVCVSCTIGTLILRRNHQWSSSLVFSLTHGYYAACTCITRHSSCRHL